MLKKISFQINHLYIYECSCMSQTGLHAFINQK